MNWRRCIPRMSMPAVLCLLLCTSVVRAEEDGLVSRWRLTPPRIKSRTIRPVVGGLGAQIAGPVTFSKERPRVLVFDGDDSRKHHAVNTDNLAAAKLPSQEMTAEAFVQIEKIVPWGGICGVIQDNGSFERGWLLGNVNSAFSFGLASAKTGKLTYLQSRKSIERGHWYHVVGTYDGRVQRIYVDGQLQGESTAQSGPIAYPPTGVYCIGAYRDDNEFHALNGRIEEVSVYSRALSADEVLARFEKRKSQFPGIEAVHPEVTDWPTYNRDNQRTGIAAEEIQFPLKPRWVHQTRHPPAPAWPAPANQDFWHGHAKLNARVTYDRAFHLVTVGNRVYFGSSADDRVSCLAADTGELLWSFFTEGPVRLAPTVSGNRIMFGSDDGVVYCLEAKTGKLLWKHRLGPSDRMIAGNERIISAWPVRTGVLVEGNIAYFCAGLFPKQGAFQAALNVRTGKRLASGQVQFSPQGYTARRAGRLHVASGRAPAGAFVAELSRRGKGVGKELRRIPAEYPYAFIGSGSVRIGGGDGQVAAFRIEDGREVWSAKVEGKAHSLAVAGGQLFVSTDAGHIYCFSPDARDVNVVTAPAIREFPYANPTDQQRTLETADWIVETAGVKRGYCLVLGSGTGSLVYELAQRTDLNIVGVESDAVKVRSSRRAIEAAGLYGRVVIHHAAPKGSLPYTDYLFNLIVAEEFLDGNASVVKRDDVLRVLRPHGGVALFGREQDDIVRRGVLKGVGEWSHMYANAGNTVCSEDQHVGSQFRLQWFGRPGPQQMIDRHHRTVAPLSTGGRLFVPANNRVIAVDAYNGTQLWNEVIPNSRRVGAFRDCSYMVATDDHLYVAAEGRCHGLNAETGEQDLNFGVPVIEEDGTRDWGYVARVDELLIGSTTRPGASRHEHSKASISEGTYFDFRPLVCSDSLFAVDRRTGAPRWHYKAAAGVIVNSTITVADRRAFFVESENSATRTVASGRVPLGELVGQGARLVAIDVQTGKVAWQQAHDFSAMQHNVFGCSAQGRLVIIGTRNSSTDKKTARVMYDVHVFDAASGKPAWSTSQTQPTAIGGSHGEQDHHPVIVGNRLYVEPFAYDLRTGKPLPNWGWAAKKRSGCGTISASASSLFFRQSNPTLFDLVNNKYDKVTAVTRPGCWINMIPAGGLLLIPEASSGCTCNFAVQTSLAFLPTPKQSNR